LSLVSFLYWHYYYYSSKLIKIEFLIIKKWERGKGVGYIQSKGADTEGGIAVGESETGVELGESTAAEEAVTVS